MTHAVGTEVIPGLPGEETRVFVGHPHAQTDDWIEVMVAKTTGNNFTVFHAMPLTDLYRHLITGKE
ncbi:MAG: hypothetical protein LBN10_00125 [Propionibacteriaceae bacterium]|nr:hypothetical protein [Propionibacteriaceae bacterium]